MNLLMLLSICFHLNALPCKVDLENAWISEAIPLEVYEEIVEAVESSLEIYARAGSVYRSMDSHQIEEDHLKFIALFAEDAVITDDLSWTMEELHYANYIQKVDEQFRDELKFDIQKLKILSIDVDETGFYVVDLRMEKRLFSAVSRKGKSIQLKRGRKLNLEMRIDFPNYLISDARIQYIRKYTPSPLEIIVHGLKKIITFPKKSKQ